MARVCIGMPVYNGERFVAAAIESLRAQTYEDFELIILDNASTDRTREICEAYARRDSRLRYHRNDKNVGAAPNFNRAFELSDASYFKWGAHDDLCAPCFLEKCITALDADPSLILAYSLVTEIDEDGAPIGHYDFPPDSLSPRPHVRFRRQIVGHQCYEVFGVFRTAALKRTPLIGEYAGGDAALLLELCLIGKFLEIPERLFLSRRHPSQSASMQRNFRAWAEWFKPDLSGRLVLPYWRLLSEYRRIVRTADLTAAERLFCYCSLLNWVRKRTRHLAKDIITALVSETRRRARIGERTRGNKILTTR